MSGKKMHKYSDEDIARREQKKIDKEDKEIIKQIKNIWAPRGEEAKDKEQTGYAEGEEFNLENLVDMDKSIQGKEGDPTMKLSDVADMKSITDKSDSQGRDDYEVEMDEMGWKHFLKGQYEDERKAKNIESLPQNKGTEMMKLLKDPQLGGGIEKGILASKFGGKTVKDLTKKEFNDFVEAAAWKYNQQGSLEHILSRRESAMAKLQSEASKGKESFKEYLGGAKEKFKELKRQQDTAKLGGRTQSTRSDRLERAGIDTQKLGDTFKGRIDTEAYSQLGRQAIKEARKEGKPIGAGVNVAGLEKTVGDWGKKIESYTAQEFKSGQLGNLLSKLSTGAKKEATKAWAEQKLTNKVIDMASKSIQGATRNVAGTKKSPMTGAFRKYAGGKLKGMWKAWKATKKK